MSSNIILIQQVRKLRLDETSVLLDFNSHEVVDQGLELGSMSSRLELIPEVYYPPSTPLYAPFLPK